MAPQVVTHAGQPSGVWFHLFQVRGQSRDGVHVRLGRRQRPGLLLAGMPHRVRQGQTVAKRVHPLGEPDHLRGERGGVQVAEDLLAIADLIDAAKREVEEFGQPVLFAAFDHPFDQLVQRQVRKAFRWHRVW